MFEMSDICLVAIPFRGATGDRAVRCRRQGAEKRPGRNSGEVGAGERGTPLRCSRSDHSADDGIANEARYRKIDDVVFGDRVVVQSFVNLYGCRIGSDTRVGTFVEIQRGAQIGSHCKIQSHTFICGGVRIGDGVFIGHGVTFINDRFPRATRADGHIQSDSDWQLIETVVHDGASIGSGATIMCGVCIGERAQVGAGAVVTRDVPADATAVGNPAKLIVKADALT